ncbi:MAG TPA: hypothetical protein VIL95_00675 [Bacillota bacterium]
MWAVSAVLVPLYTGAMLATMSVAGALKTVLSTTGAYGLAAVLLAAGTPWVAPPG